MVFADLRLDNCMLTQILSSRGLWLYKSCMSLVTYVASSARFLNLWASSFWDASTIMRFVYYTNHFFYHRISSMSNKYITHYILVSLSEATSVSSPSSPNKHNIWPQWSIECIETDARVYKYTNKQSSTMRTGIKQFYIFNARRMILCEFYRSQILPKQCNVLALCLYTGRWLPMPAIETIIHWLHPGFGNPQMYILCVHFLPFL